MISLKDILMGRVEFKDLPKEHQDNLMILLERINKFFEGYTWPSTLPRIVNDGYRRAQDKPKNGAALSMHFRGAAIDLDDDIKGTVWKYVWENRHRLKELGLWMEHPGYTHYIVDPKTGQEHSWLHFQILPPGSGNRFYVPSLQPNPNPSFWDGKYEASLNSKEQPK